MRVLMVTPRFPYPPDRGDSVRPWHILQRLAPGHEIWLASSDTRDVSVAELDHVRQYCRRAEVFVRSSRARLVRGAMGLLAGHSLTERYYHDPRLLACVRAWSAEAAFDAVYTYSSAVAPVGAAARATRRVLDMCDVDSVKWETYARRSLPPLSWLYRTEALRVARLEARCAGQYDVSLFVNERERRKFAQRVPHARSATLLTAVDVAACPTLDQKPLPADPVVGMVGSMFYPPNVRAVNWFGRYVWPQVQRAMPTAQWWIVGNRPTREVQRWGQLPNVTVTGFVPEIQPYFEAIRVFVNPVDGDLGVQTKLIMAMAASRPAVVTPDTAAGMDYDDPPPFYIAGSPEGFADSVVRLLRDDAQARALGQRARATAEKHYNTAHLAAGIGRWLFAGSGGDGSCPPQSKPHDGRGGALLVRGEEEVRV